jgi:hypothetical protein
MCWQAEGGGEPGANRMIAEILVMVFLVTRRCGKASQAFRAVCLFAKSTPPLPLLQSRC